MSTNKTQGDLCESIATSYYINKGYVVSKPFNHSSNYDLVIDDNETLKRVECKSSRYKDTKNSYQVSLKTSGGNTSWNGTVKKISSKTSDIIFIYTADGNIYEIPTEVLNDRTTISLNSENKYYIGNISLFSN